MEDTQSVEEALTNWQESKSTFIDLCLVYLEHHTMTDLSRQTGIKRTTLYYMLYGKSGRSATSD